VVWVKRDTLKMYQDTWNSDPAKYEPSQPCPKLNPISAVQAAMPDDCGGRLLVNEKVAPGFTLPTNL
jgi:hypothetical protein